MRDFVWHPSGSEGSSINVVWIPAMVRGSVRLSSAVCRRDDRGNAFRSSASFPVGTQRSAGCTCAIARSRGARHRCATCTPANRATGCLVRASVPFWRRPGTSAHVRHLRRISGDQRRPERAGRTVAKRNLLTVGFPRPLRERIAGRRIQRVGFSPSVPNSIATRVRATYPRCTTPSLLMDRLDLGGFFVGQIS